MKQILIKYSRDLDFVNSEEQFGHTGLGLILHKVLNLSGCLKHCIYTRLAEIKRLSNPYWVRRKGSNTEFWCQKESQKSSTD